MTTSMKTFGACNQPFALPWIGPRERILLSPVPLPGADFPMNLHVDLYTPGDDEEWDVDEWEAQMIYIEFRPCAFKEAYSAARSILRNHGLSAGEEV